MSIKSFVLNKDHIALDSYTELKSIRALIEKEFHNLEPGENTKNKLDRGIRWGIIANNQKTWLQRNTYQLDDKFNQEESGNTRKFTLISDEFINHKVIDQLITNHFNKWRFEEGSDWRAYEVQVSLIGYKATWLETAIPAPAIAHQDMIDGSVTVLHREGDIEGGITRVFNLDGEMLVEADLHVGDSIFMVDSETKHLVTPISIPFGSCTGKARRLIMIIRFQPLGR